MSPAGLTLDAGALIALERRKERALKMIKTAVAHGRPVTVPAVVLAEWWRGRTDAREAILRGVRVEPSDERLAKATGEALVAIPEATVIDALVMASAARRGDAVLTTDFDDLDRLRAFFPVARVLVV